MNEDETLPPLYSWEAREERASLRRVVLIVMILSVLVVVGLTMSEV